MTPKKAKEKRTLVAFFRQLSHVLNEKGSPIDETAFNKSATKLDAYGITKKLLAILIR